jgi:hypothetical protein
MGTIPLSRLVRTTSGFSLMQPFFTPRFPALFQSPAPFLLPPALTMIVFWETQ